MAGRGIPEITIADSAAFLSEKDTVAIVASRWHSEVMDGLINSALRGLSESPVAQMMIRVPGTFELPLGAKYAIEAGADAVVALGVVVRGDTPHFDYVCDGVTRGLTDLSLATATPIGFGVLTCDNDLQAYARAGFANSTEDKGYETAAAALEMLALRRQLAG